MRVLKAAVLLALTTFIILFPSGGGAYADAPQTVKTYAYVDLGSEVYFCNAKNEESALFIIPQTYCVQILGREDDWYYVKYAEDNGIYRAVYGYCPTSDLVLTDEPLENLYLHYTITVIYRSDSATSLLPGLKDIEITAAYYGAYTVGKTTCSYVLCNDNFGYIPDTVDDYPLNKLPDSQTIAPAPEPQSNNTLITALAITGIAAAAIVILYFTGRKPKSPED